MASAFLSSIRSKTSQVLGFVQRCAVSPSSSSDPCSSVLKDLMKLEKTLKRIQAVFHDAEEKEIRDEAVKLWLKELKEVAYDAEDVLDEYHYEVLRAQVLEGPASLKRKRVDQGDDEEEVSGSLSTIAVSIPDGMGDRIREITENFYEISEDRERLDLREEDGERRVLKDPYPAPTSHIVDESRIFGRESDRQNVIDLLLSEGMGNVISVIPIVGKGGLGKTTITQLVYNDSKVKDYFDLTGWVCVSDDFDVTRLTMAIIESLAQSSCDPTLIETSCHLTQLSTLQDILKEKVQGMRVLLVLDDVWNEQQSRWESLTNPFVCAEIVRIIVTCRNDSVAEIMQTDVSPYHPAYLSPEQSWSLFRHYAFGGRDPEEQPCLADIGKQIVEKCSGLPLAVKTVGSLLRHEIDEDGWMEVLQSDLWELDRNNEILGSLRLSYSRMPAHLKPCFVYCSVFPKDFAFDKGDLIRLWMAQGYIPSGGRRRMEDVGHEYFNDLLKRSFFDPFHHGFKMHDMIHDLAKFIAEDECYTIVDKKLPDSLEKVRHFYGEGVKKLVKSLNSCNLRALRTLLLRNLYKQPMAIQEMTQFLLPLRCLRVLQLSWEGKGEIPDLLGNLKHLRYLGIRSMDIKKLPESVCHLYHLQTLIVDCFYLAELPSGIGNLEHLRYLNISSYDIKKLPESVCHLYHLQTLIVKCFRLIELPNSIANLTNLRYLDIPCNLPFGIRKLTNLQFLHARCTVHDRIGVLKQLVNLAVLCISGLRNVVNIEDAKDAGLKHKHELEWLFLYWNVVAYKDVREKWFDGEDNRSLHLEAFPEENKDVPIDEKREEAMLEYLQPHANLKKLVVNGYGGSKFPTWVGNPFSFASLQEIDIIDCEKIRSLHPLGKWDPPISKSVLQRVCISGCRQLTSIAGLQNLHSLKNLKICNCPQLQLLSEEGLPSKLQNLDIEECQQLTALSGMQNLTSLEKLVVENCPQLRLFSEEGLPSNLQYLYIEGCQQLTSLSGMQNLISLRELTTKNCPQLQLLSEEGLPSNFQKLHIEDCQKLTSLLGIQNLTPLEKLTIKNCPKLQIMAEDQLSCMPHDVEIVDCPGLSNWSQIQKINCFQVSSGNKLTISNTWENIRQGFNYLTSTEHGFDESSASTVELLQPRSHLFLSDRWKFFSKRSVLEELTIWSCTRIPTLWRLSWSRSLHSLVIKDCPGDELLPDDLLPSTLKSLVVDSCKNLRFLQLAQANRDALEELQIVNCPMLVMVEGLNQLFFLKILRIEECPQLLLSQEDLQPFIPPRVELQEYWRRHSILHIQMIATCVNSHSSGFLLVAAHSHWYKSLQNHRWHLQRE